MGCTTLAVQIAATVRPKRPSGVCLFSLAEPRDEVESRLRTMGGGPRRSTFRIDDTAGLELSRLSKRASAVVPRGGLVVVDYLQLLRGAPTVGTRVQQLESALKTLKTLAKKAQVTVLIVAHIGRTVDERADKRPRLEDLPVDSAGVDTVWFLFHKSYYTRGLPSGAEVLVAKAPEPISTRRIKLTLDLRRRRFLSTE